MNINLYIRAATEEDIPAILNLYREAQIDGERGFTAEEATAHFASLERYPYFRVFVALAGEVIAGTYELVILDNMAKRGRRSGVVEDVAVHPDHQGQGIGRAMMQHALDQCSRAECYKLTLSSNLKRDGAHLFYDSLGFTRHGYSFQIELAES
jgi:ribosomal protein S18 acetylase RimI-like enzyme